MKKETNWIYPEQKTISDELIKFTGSEIIAGLLVNRNITKVEEAKLFLNPTNVTFSSPYAFKDMEKTVERIKKAIEDNEYIVIYGDFDADGVTSTSLLYKTLKHLNANVSYYIPDRATESHGLNSSAVCKIISGRKAKLIITVDCGISNLVEITLAKSLGTDVIITDHHEAPELIPPAFSIINPKAPKALCEDLTEEQQQNLKYLAGVGVAYKLAEALLDKYNQSDFKDEILHLVAIGTIADVVPLLGENRGYVLKGLNLIEKLQPTGIIKLLEIAGSSIEKGITSDTIAFSIAPRINAAGRLDSATVAVELLTEEDNEKISLCAKKLDHNNRTRQQMCDTTFMEAEVKISREIDLTNNKAIILAEKNWHPGIIGIVASKIVEKYHKPTFLITINREKKEARCSARGIEGLNIYETLCTHSNYFKYFGGHALAAGFCVDLDDANLDNCINDLNSTINKSIAPEYLQPRLKLDFEISPQDLTIDFINKIETLAPFGEGNPSPVFSLSEVSLRQYKTMGAAKNHLKIFLADSKNNLLEAVWWSKNSLNIDLLEQVKVAFSPKINTFGNKTNIQLEMKDIKTLNQKQTEEVIETKQSPKWIDHRKRTGIEKALLSYLKTAKDKVIIFAENRTILESIKKHELFSNKTVNRMDIEEADQLIFFDIPCNKELFDELIKKSNPKMVHLVEFNQPNNDHITLIKNISGMLKFAYLNRDGIVSLQEVSSKLSTSVDVLNSCIKLLTKAGVINFLKEEENILHFEFIKGMDLSSLSEFEEFEVFLKYVKETEKFRQQFINEDISTLKNNLAIILSKNDIPAMI